MNGWATGLEAMNFGRRILAGSYGFNANISFTFQAVSLLIPHIYVSGFLVSVLVSFGYIWGNMVFLKE